MGIVGRPSTAALARLELDNELGLWMSALDEYPDSAQGRDDAVAWFATGLPAAFFNQVLTIGDRPDAGSLERAIAAIRARDVPFHVRLRAGVDDELVPRLVELGFREDDDESLPGMAAWPIADGLPGPAARDALPHDLDIRRVDDEASFEEHLGVIADGFGMPLDLARRLFPPGSLDRPGLAAFTGYRDGRPVTTSLAYTKDGTVGVYNVATLFEARRRGYGAAMTRRAVDDGRERGATVAILQSSVMGRRVYESLGFEEVVWYRAFLEASASPGVPPG
jgi:GNAT superfamily N-acetyltransferase